MFKRTFLNKKKYVSYLTIALGLSVAPSLSAFSYDNSSSSNPSSNYSNPSSNPGSARDSYSGSSSKDSYSNPGSSGSRDSNSGSSGSRDSSSNPGSSSSRDSDSSPGSSSSGGSSSNPGSSSSGSNDSFSNYSSQRDINPNSSSYYNPSGSSYSNAKDPYSGSSSATYSETSGDQELARRIREKISSGWFSRGYDRVSVQVNNGAVIIQGVVKSQADKDKVEKEIRDIDGVKSLTSHVNVEESHARGHEERQFLQDRAATSEDQQLNKKIRDNVSKGWLWDSYKDVSLNTSNGVVTLDGTVGSESDKQDLINEVQKVEGVKSVKSNLRIESRY